MVIKYGFLGNKMLSKLMYKDRLTASREGESQRNSDGSVGSATLSSFLVDEPCLVHETTKDASKDGNLDVARQEVIVTVFVGNCGIQRGDVLELSKINDDGTICKVITGLAGQPTYYPDHLEINLYEWKVS